MAGERIGQRHKKRFRRWQQRLGPMTRFLSERIESELVPVIEAQGFQWVDLVLRDPGNPVSKHEINLERTNADSIEYLSIAFWNWGVPRFQICFGRRELADPQEWVRSANLVRSSRQYYHFWGKPWWMPNWAWSEKNSQQTIKGVKEKIGQAFRFLDTGECGPNISRQDLSWTSRERLESRLVSLAMTRGLSVAAGLVLALPFWLVGQELRVLPAYAAGDTLMSIALIKPAFLGGWLAMTLHIVVSALWIVLIWKAFV